MKVFFWLKDRKSDIALLKKTVKNRKCLKMKTTEDFKKSCFVGDVLFIKHDDRLCFPMVVTSISKNRENVRLEPYYYSNDVLRYDYSMFDIDFMHAVKAIYPNGDPFKFEN